MSKDEMLSVVRTLIEEVMQARFDGVAYAKLTRAHGFADGYMRALMDAGLAERKELLDLVGATRREIVDEANTPLVTTTAATAA